MSEFIQIPVQIVVEGVATNNEKDHSKTSEQQLRQVIGNVRTNCDEHSQNDAHCTHETVSNPE